MADSFPCFVIVSCLAVDMRTVTLKNSYQEEASFDHQWRLNGHKTLLMAHGSHKASVAVIDCMRGPMDGAPFVTHGLRAGRAQIVSRFMCKS
jgi:hypothetical protein